MPLSDSFDVILPVGLRESSSDPYVELVAPNDEGVGYFYTSYSTEELRSYGSEWIQHNELYSFDATGKTKLINLPEHDWINITPAVGDEDGFYVSIGNNIETNSVWSWTEDFYFYDASSITDSWIALSEDDYWDAIFDFRGEYSIYQKDGVLLFDALELTDNPEGYSGLSVSSNASKRTYR